MNDYYREKYLLIEAARYPLSIEKTDARHTVTLASLDWEYVLTQAGHHGLSPMLFRMLTDEDLSNRIPTTAFDALRHSYVASLHNNLNLYKQLVKVLDSFASRQVPVILLKGAALCLNTYPDMAFRPFGDLDILVMKRDVPKCQKLLEDLDFELLKESYFPVPDEKNDELGCEWSYFNNQAVVELHWDLIDRLAPFPIDIDLFWEDARPVEYQGATALAMSPENQFIHLCLHQYKHHWVHLRDFTDIALVLQKFGSELDWDKLTRRIHEQELGRCVYYTLDLMHKVMNIPLTDVPMRQILGRRHPGRISQGMMDLIASQIFEKNMPRRFWELVLVEGSRNRAKLLGRILAQPFPRDDQGEKTQSRETSFKGRVRETLKSFYFYRSLFLLFLKRLSQLLKRQGGH